MTKRGAVILLVENDENDLFFFRRALASCKFAGELRVVDSVAQAIEYMEARGKFHDRAYYPVPDLIVTDFKLPGQTGVDLIDWVRARKTYEEIPMVMFSGTALAADKAAALKSGARAFFAKSGDYRQMCEQMTEVLAFLPARADHQDFLTGTDANACDTPAIIQTKEKLRGASPRP
jgi:CheY-like chemotaxis protein